MAPADLTGEVTDLLQQLIRNRCVNDGTPASGHEVRSVDLLESYLRFPGAELKRYEPVPGRASLVLRIPGSDPRAPTLHFMGHTDVVPVTPSGWRHDQAADHDLREGLPLGATSHAGHAGPRVVAVPVG